MLFFFLFSTPKAFELSNIMVNGLEPGIRVKGLAQRVKCGGTMAPFDWQDEHVAASAALQCLWLTCFLLHVLTRVLGG